MSKAVGRCAEPAEAGTVLPIGIYIRNPHFARHDTGAHPENAGRILAIEERLAAVEFHGLEVIDARAASEDQLRRVHSPEHIAGLTEICEQGGGSADPDTLLSAGSCRAAAYAAGALVGAVDRVLDGQDDFAFCAVRPPGHHAETEQAMGFCLYNNVAVGARHASARGASRAAVIDWDVHHGNGTQEIFYEDPDVLYLSVHQSPLYPGTGAEGETGRGAGTGTNVNLPVPPGAGGTEFLDRITAVAVPAMRRHRPEIVFVSAGFDAHTSDPLAECELVSADFGSMAAEIAAAAAELDVPVVACLEGGYDPHALAESVDASIAGFTAA